MKGISCQFCISKFVVIKLLFAILKANVKCQETLAAFSNQRLLIANFFVAEKVLQDLVLQLHPRSTWHSFLPAKRMDIVVSALEMNEGGLSQVEERILHEVVAGATLMKYRQFHIHAQSAVLSDSAVMAMLKQK